MKTFTKTQAKRQLEQVLDSIVAGDGVMVTKRGKTVLVMKPGEVFVTRRERTPEQVARAAAALKKRMPGVARKGQKTAQEILRELRDER